MKYIQCPAELNPEVAAQTLFLARGISNCPDCQSALRKCPKMTSMLGQPNTPESRCIARILGKK